MNLPLPELMRPKKIEDVVGQTHLLGPKGSLTKLLKQDHLPSIIFWGPPGVGKTTLAYILAKTFNYKFIELSGVDFSVKSLEQIKPKAAPPGLLDSTDRSGVSVVFVDEIHRLNKSQQAQFLPYVERGEWILIGATTENPSFEVISPLLSRSQVLVLKVLEPTDLRKLVDRGIEKIKETNPKFSLNDENRNFLVQISNGDARVTLNALSATYRLFPTGKATREELKEALGSLHLVYDKHGDEHFDTISALHKSMRGSDPNAAIYYLARMLEAGEKPEYVARRCLRFAAEDIGNADPMALVLANTAFEAVNKIGMPESDVILAQLVIYLAKAPKSNQAYVGYARVRSDIQKYGNLPIPLKIRNAPTDLMKDIGYGKDYKYPHDFAPEELEGEQYLPDKLKDRDYLAPTK
jgi:putative ATPase